MPNLLKRNKAPKDQAGSPGPDAGNGLAAEEAAPEEAAARAPEPAPAPPPARTSEAPPAQAGNGNGNDGYETIMTSGGLLTRMYGPPGEMSRADRERQAAMEFEQAVAPVLDMLVGSVPEASTPDEAARALESQVGDLLPDPGAGSYIPGDAYDREARVYYRLLRRDYEKNPRPSLTKNKKASHHLHSQYKSFPGTRGW